MNPLLAEFFHHNRWANLRLLEACAGLADGQWAAGAPGTYGSVRDTLVHLLAAEQRYVSSFGNAGAPVVVSEREPFPGIEALRASADWSGSALVDEAAASAPDRVLRGEWRGRPFAMPVALLLLQAINHATEHRAQIATILTQVGIEPPALDGWAFEPEIRSRWDAS